jgi:hypothetical protein
MYKVTRPLAIVNKTRATYDAMNKVMDTTINACMSRYKPVLQDIEYLYWMEFFIEVIRDEIFGYIKHQYSRIPSKEPHSFARFIEREFNTLLVPVFDKIIHKNSNEVKRQMVIMQCNQELQQCSGIDGSLDRSCKVHFDTSANTLHVFERDDDE